MSLPARMGQGRAFKNRTEHPDLDVPIVLCPNCKRWPMAIKSVHQRLLKKAAPIRVDLLCPKCGAMTTVAAPSG